MIDWPWRLAFLAILLGNVGLSGRHRKRVWDQVAEQIPRGAEPGWLKASRAAAALPMIFGSLLWVAWPPAMQWARLELPDAVRAAAVALGFGLLPLNAWVLSSLGSNISETVLTKPGQQLVTHGPYRWVRHPLYTTGLLMFLALALLASNAFLLAMTALFALLVRMVIVPREEANLVAEFGDAYRAYRAATGALLPAPWRRT